MLDAVFRLRNDSARPALLVSVRNAQEALAAIAGGADVIDVKEPSRGALGAADVETIADIVGVIAGRVPVTVAAGELLGYIARPSWSGPRDIRGVSLVKIGLAGCALRDGWQRLWQYAAQELGGSSKVAAVVYADWQLAAAPRPDAILAAADEAGCPAVLVDTWDKSAGSLLDHWTASELRDFVDQVHACGMISALAGSLSLTNVREVVECGADVVAVRGAACEGRRVGRISSVKVAAIRQRLEVDRPVGTT